MQASFRHRERSPSRTGGGFGENFDAVLGLTEAIQGDELEEDVVVEVPWYASSGARLCARDLRSAMWLVSGAKQCIFLSSHKSTAEHGASMTQTWRLMLLTLVFAYGRSRVGRLVTSLPPLA